jgi:hypothetical protein
MTKYALIYVLLLREDFPINWPEAINELLSLIKITSDVNLQKLYMSKFLSIEFIHPYRFHCESLISFRGRTHWKIRSKVYLSSWVVGKSERWLKNRTDQRYNFCSQLSSPELLNIWWRNGKWCFRSNGITDWLECIRVIWRFDWVIKELLG